MRRCLVLGSPHVGADLDLEYRTLELLKQRFGEDSLHKCEVMLKDIKSSDRCSININAKLNEDSAEYDTDADTGDAQCLTSVVHPMIVSQVFWPQLPGTSAVSDSHFP
jgi:anaphase-promoting complex subunit 2